MASRKYGDPTSKGRGDQRNSCWQRESRLIDPLQSLAFSIQANPGVYALLVGSGVSRSSGIPTGWEIVLDLLGKLAVLAGDAGNRDLEQWYKEEYQELPDYSKLLDMLAKTPNERQQLLRPYFEPDDQEREDGLKQPTAAHRAIARLVAQGFVKVIVTTNFDRLLENALEEEGVAPTVLSTLEEVKGASPLVHLDCCVFKVHGDYRDPGIRNTESELEKYPPEFEKFLDRVFDEYGLVVCGWSAEWDIGLRKALSSVKSRRFSTYWAARDELRDPAQRLISQRDAQVIPIEGADSFFQTVQQNVEAIEEYSKPHPLSTESAVASLKRYLSSQEYKIQLSDHIGAVVEQVIENVTGGGFDQDDPVPDVTTVATRMRRYESACETLMAMAAVGGYWASEDNSVSWERAVERLSTVRPVSGRYYSAWFSLRMYPATLLVYALGLGALETGNLGLINRIFRRTVTTGDDAGRTQAISSVLPILALALTESGHWKGLLEGMENHLLPINEWLHDALREPLKALIPEDDKYSYVFDKLEILVALGSDSMRNRDSSLGEWFPLGSYIWRSRNSTRIVSEIEESVQIEVDSVFVASGIFGDTRYDCLQRLERFKNWIPQTRKQLRIFIP